eukprot:Gb_04887 [translate_table: standard]
MSCSIRVEEPHRSWLHGAAACLCEEYDDGAELKTLNQQRSESRRRQMEPSRAVEKQSAKRHGHIWNMKRRRKARSKAEGSRPVCSSVVKRRPWRPIEQSRRIRTTAATLQARGSLRFEGLGGMARVWDVKSLPEMKSHCNIFILEMCLVVRHLISVRASPECQFAV